MEDNRTDYEPNFVIRDAEPKAVPDLEELEAALNRASEEIRAETAAPAEEKPQASSVWENHSKETPIAENASYVTADTFYGDEAPTPQPTTPSLRCLPRRT